MASAASIKPLTGSNYDEWVLDARGHLSAMGYWGVVIGSEIPPEKPIVPKDAENTPSDNPLVAESNDPAYLTRFDRYRAEYKQYTSNILKASGTIFGLLDGNLKRKYGDEKWSADPAGLWNEIKTERERVLKIDGKHLMQKLVNIKFSEFDTSAEYYTVVKDTAARVGTCGIPLNDQAIAFFMLNGLPETDEWTSFSSNLNMSGKDVDPETIMRHLEVFESMLRKKHGIPGDTALFAKGGTRYNGKGNQSRRGGKNQGSGSRETSADTKGGKPAITCYGCGKNGHKKQECRSRNLWDDKHGKGKQATAHTAQVQDPSDIEDSLLLSAEHTPIIDEIKAATPSKGLGGNRWIVDSGATSHVTGIASIFVNYRQLRRGERMIKVADDRFIHVAGIGDIAIAFEGGSKQVLQEVLHVIEFGENSLLSVFRLLSAGFHVDFALDTTKLTRARSKRLVATGPVIGGLFYLGTVGEAVNTAASAFASVDATSGSSDAMRWHNRLGHLGLRAVKRLPEVVNGMELTEAGVPDTCLCEACIFGKLSRKPFKSVDPERRSTKPMSLIHSDVVGPFKTRSHSGKRYMVVFTDDCTRWSEAYFMELKSEVPEKFKSFLAKVEKQGYGKVQKLRSDGGGEYTGGDFTRYLQANGITQQITAPYSPASNGISERTNRAILDPVRSMLKHAGLPNAFWAEASSVAVYIKNRVLHSALGMSPYEALHGKKPDISHLRVFGCAAYAHVPIEKGRQKLDDRAKRCIFIGYTESTSIWKLYDPATKRGLTSRDVKFDESIVY